MPWLLMLSYSIYFLQLMLRDIDRYPFSRSL